jgi:hypothetical protein
MGEMMRANLGLTWLSASWATKRCSSAVVSASVEEDVRRCKLFEAGADRRFG